MRRMLFGLAITAIATLVPAWATAGQSEDSQTAQQIKAVLSDSGMLHNYRIKVDCKNGTCWLSGRVASNQQMAAALDLVQTVDGIHLIKNGLTVEAGAPATASKLRQPSKQAVARIGASASRSNVKLATASGMPLGAPAPLASANRRASGSAPAPTGRPLPAYAPGVGGGVAPATYDQAHMPNYSWPSYAAYPNYAAVTYPKQYSATAWPFIGPFYPYPQVPMGWRKVSLEWDDGWWFLDFNDRGCWR